MFVFGDPVETARIYLDDWMRVSGPQVPDVHYEELETQDLRNLMAYLYGALRDALSNEEEGEWVNVLTSWYDEMFVAVAAEDKEFRESYRRHLVIPPQGVTAKSRAKYNALFETALES